MRKPACRSPGVGGSPSLGLQMGGWHRGSGSSSSTCPWQSPSGVPVSLGKGRAPRKQRPRAPTGPRRAGRGHVRPGGPPVPAWPAFTFSGVPSRACSDGRCSRSQVHRFTRWRRVRTQNSPLQPFGGTSVALSPFTLLRSLRTEGGEPGTQRAVPPRPPPGLCSPPCDCAFRTFQRGHTIRGVL